VKIEQGPLYDPPERPSVEQKHAYYWSPDGEGFQQALREARAILEVGGSEAEAAEWIGFTVKQLREALRVESPTANVETVEIATPEIPAVQSLAPVIEAPAAPVIGRDTPSEAA
jgi:hypothetical protein